MVDCVRLMSSQGSIVMIVQARQSTPGLFKLSQKSKSSISISWIPVSQYNNPTSQLPPVQTSIILGLVCVQGTVNRGDLLPNAETPPEGKTEPGYGIKPPNFSQNRETQYNFALLPRVLATSLPGGTFLCFVHQLFTSSCPAMQPSQFPLNRFCPEPEPCRKKCQVLT